MSEAGYEDLRHEVRSWLEANVPASLRTATRIEDRIELARLLAGRGLLGYTWPAEFGGHDGTPREAIVVEDELAKAGVPTSSSPAANGFRNMGPTLLAHGTEQQRRTFLPRIRSVADIWCQGFSEPGAGSDLAAVSTRAVRDGDVYKITGSKIWTSHAHYANWCYVLAKTSSAPRHRNLTFLLVPIDQPGVEVRPIKQLTGETHFNEVFFDEAVTSAENVIGEDGGGWAIAVSLLSTERGSNLMRHRQFLAELGLLAEQADTESDRLEVGNLYAHLLGIEAASVRMVATLDDPTSNDLALASGGKLVNTEFHQRIAERALMMAVGGDGDLDRSFSGFLQARAATIYGGTSQIQRNIIAERVLGLPR